MGASLHDSTHLSTFGELLSAFPACAAERQDFISRLPSESLHELLAHLNLPPWLRRASLSAQLKYVRYCLDRWDPPPWALGKGCQSERNVRYLWHLLGLPGTPEKPKKESPWL